MTLFVICFVSLFVVFIFTYLVFPIAGAPYYPSKISTVEKMIRIGEIKKSDYIVDLGSGDGRIVLLLAQKGYKVRGVEINIFLVIFSNLLLIITGNFSRGRVYLGNIKNHDLSDYDIVYVYLFRGILKNLKEKFLTEMKSSAKIISNTFEIDNFKKSKLEEKIIIYKIDEQANS